MHCLHVVTVTLDGDIYIQYLLQSTKTLTFLYIGS